MSYAGMLLAAAGLLLAAAGAAHASPVPDSTRIATLRVACTSWNRVRIQSSRGIFTLGSPKFDSIGLVLRVPPRRPSLIMDRPAADAAPERVRWSDIQRIDGTHSHAGRGFAEGAVAGTIVGLSTALLLVAGNTGEDFGAIGYVPLGFLLGGLLGAGLGSSSGWTALYL